MKKFILYLGVLMVSGMLLTGCGQDNAVAETSEEITEQIPAEETEEALDETSEEIVEDVEEAVEEAADDVLVRIGALKGPTSIGLLKLEESAANNEAALNYDFTMVTAADELMTMLVKGDLDIALIPANVSSVLYNKTQGSISVIDINTLGVLYIVSGDDSIKSVEDLEGRTIYLTGKGNTPDYTLSYVLNKNDLLDKVTLEYKSEATEVAATLAEDETAVGLLPEPFVTAACMQNDKLKVIFDMNNLWDEVSDNHMVTGVTVVRNEFLSEHKGAVDTFLQEHASSVEAVLSDIEGSAVLAVDKGIIAKEPIALKAISKCNITCITGEDMKNNLEGYLEVLFGMDSNSVGGSLPVEDFYYIP